MQNTSDGSFLDNRRNAHQDRTSFVEKGFLGRYYTVEGHEWLHVFVLCFWVNLCFSWHESMIAYYLKRLYTSRNARMWSVVRRKDRSAEWYPMSKNYKIFGSFIPRNQRCCVELRLPRARARRRTSERNTKLIVLKSLERIYLFLVFIWNRFFTIIYKHSI